MQRNLLFWWCSAHGSTRAQVAQKFMPCETCRLFRRLGMAANSESSDESSDEGAEHTAPVPSGSSDRPGGSGQRTMPATGHLSNEAETAGGLLQPGESVPTWDEIVQSIDYQTPLEEGGPSMEPYLGRLTQSPGSSDAEGMDGSSRATEPMDGRESMWLRREQSSEAAAATEQRAWIRISGSEEVMEAFRKELRAKEPEAQVFTPAVVRTGTTRVHSSAARWYVRGSR